MRAPSPESCEDATQNEVRAFLGATDTYGPSGAAVEQHHTHGAIVFLAGDHAHKIKRCVRYPYMDFSTIELRQRACQREIDINRPLAPDIYLGIVAITREADGRLAIGGRGEPVEWAVHMRRFAGDALLSCVAERQGIDTQLARGLADAVHACHAQAEVDKQADAADRVRQILAGLVSGLVALGSAFDQDTVRRLDERGHRHLDAAAVLLEKRAAAGFVRRCHGDLHLGNILLWEGRPTLFDALEFDERLATIDTLYDLAFLLMDLDFRGQRAAANFVLNRYLWRSQSALDLEGLGALPLFLALRAGIRAMVGGQRADLEGNTAVDCADSGNYLKAALDYLAPASPRLVAVAGLSGTGKSTLAAALAPGLAPAPGAIHLRSDLERKSMLGAGETERLPASFYAPDVNRRVYDVLMRKARIALSAGHSVIVDAVFLAESERAEVERIAQDLRLPFVGLWLSAPEAILLERVGRRVGDASDATPDVVRRQLEWQAQSCGGAWSKVDAGGSSDDTLRAARSVLARAAGTVATEASTA